MISNNPVGYYALAASILLSACADPMPNCSDNSVKELALSLAKDTVKQILIMTPDAFISLSASLNKDDPTDQKILFQALQGGVDFKLLKTSQNPKVIELVKHVEDEANGVRLESIRISSSDINTKKIVCEADLLLKNGNKGAIKYSGQITDDKQVRVELLKIE
jgi:hypothetical protein